VVGKENAREVFLNDDFSFSKAVADKFDAAGMIGIYNPEKFDRLTTIITRHLTPNLNAFNKRVNEQVKRCLMLQTCLYILSYIVL
jgi:hypothetical protein